LRDERAELVLEGWRVLGELAPRDADHAVAGGDGSVESVRPAFCIDVMSYVGRVGHSSILAARA
jgi:hypothetical protein